MINRASRTYAANFNKETWFERAVFLSWHCDNADCAFCYMSLAQDTIKQPKAAKRSPDSVLAEVTLCHELGWKIGFLSAGTGAYTIDELKKLTGRVYELYGEPVCINAGPFTKEQLQQLQPAVDSVCVSIETVNWRLRRDVCPSKPLEPYLETLDAARELGMKRVMTLIIGLGERREDYPKLKRFLDAQRIDKIVVYGLVPHDGSRFTAPADPKDLEWWIAQTRLDFPDLEIVAGIWHDRGPQLERFLQAGANSFTKFQAVKYYGGKEAQSIIRATKSAGRQLKSTLSGTRVLDTVENTLCKEPNGHGVGVCKKLGKYIRKMRKNASSLQLQNS